LVLIVFGLVFLFLRWWSARCASGLVILKTSDLSEQAVLELPLAISYGLHGSWAAH
jgi:all-trans-8'-apo-beta-carotenal 15,15'-oxygenase